MPVSYTHLDVYKRQLVYTVMHCVCVYAVHCNVQRCMTNESFNKTNFAFNVVIVTLNIVYDVINSEITYRLITQVCWRYLVCLCASSIKLLQSVRREQVFYVEFTVYEYPIIPKTN